MNENDEQRFVQLFNRLSVALPMQDAGDADVRVQRMDVYFDALAYIPIEDVEAAAEKLFTEGSGFFPSTREWSEVADHLAYERLLKERHEAKSLPPSPERSDAWSKAKRARARFLAELREKPKANNGIDWSKLADSFERAIPCRPPIEPHCQSCDDSGYAKRECDKDSRCSAHVFDVDQAFEPHDYRQRCGCAETNPVIQRRLELSRHQRPTKRRRTE